MLAFDQVFTIIACVLACTISFVLGMKEGEKYLARFVKSSPIPGQLRAGTYMPALDLVCLNPDVIRGIDFKGFIEIAVHEYFHLHKHRFDLNMDSEPLEKEAYGWSSQMMMLLGEKLDWVELEKYVGLMRGYEVPDEKE